MNDSSQFPSPQDGMKNLEENPEKADATPEPDEQTESVTRHEGQMTTEMGEESVSDLLSKV